MGKPLGAVDRPALEEVELDPARQLDDRPARDCEQAGDVSGRAGRDDQPRAGAGPATHPLLPGLREPPAGRSARLEDAQHRQLGAVQLPDHRQRRERATRGLVCRGEMVEVQQFRPRPRRHGRARPPTPRPATRTPRRRRSRTPDRARPADPRTRAETAAHPPDRASSRPLTRSRPAKKVGACVCSPGRPSEPAASVTSQPARGRARPSARATWAEPPRGKRTAPKQRGDPNPRRRAPRRSYQPALGLRHRYQFSPGRARPGFVAARARPVLSSRRIWRSSSSGQPADASAAARW